MWAINLFSVLPDRKMFFIPYVVSLRIHYGNGIDNTKIALEGKKNLNLDSCFTNSHSGARWWKYSQPFRAGFCSSGACSGQDDLSLPFDERPLVVDGEYARLHLAPRFFVTQDAQCLIWSILLEPWRREASPPRFHVLCGLWCSWTIRINMLFFVLGFIFLYIFFFPLLLL